MKWVKLTNTEGHPVYVNLERVAGMVWDEHHKCTALGFGSGDVPNTRVREMPEDILRTFGASAY